MAVVDVLSQSGEILPLFLDGSGFHEVVNQFSELLLDEERALGDLLLHFLLPNDSVSHGSILSEMINMVKED